VIAVNGFHIREVTGSSPLAPTFSTPWLFDQGVFVS
jgi:hypothetical protein